MAHSTYKIDDKNVLSYIEENSFNKNFNEIVISEIEGVVKNKISEISQKRTIEECMPIFDLLENIQHLLAIATYKQKIEIGNNLTNFVRSFDRIDDQFTRNFWYKKFQNGHEWPNLV